uniref:Ig-like domain-containing protein n=1 Tax=Macrostomum lignano TaxID=282301 RepID=A0A1I8F5W3_9PLAT
LEASDSLSSSRQHSQRAASSSRRCQPTCQRIVVVNDLEQLWDYRQPAGSATQSLKTTLRGRKSTRLMRLEGGRLLACCQLRQSTRQAAPPSPPVGRLEAAMSIPVDKKSAYFFNANKPPASIIIVINDSKAKKAFSTSSFSTSSCLIQPGVATGRRWPSWPPNCPRVGVVFADSVWTRRRRLRHRQWGASKDAVGPADVSVAAEEEDDGLSSFRCYWLERRGLPAEVTCRSAYVDGTGWPPSDCGGRQPPARQITEAALAVAEKTGKSIFDIVADCRRYSTADEAAEDARQMGELDAQLRRWLAGPGGLRTRLVEAARLPTSACASGQQRRQRRRVKEKLDSLDLMRRCFRATGDATWIDNTVLKQRAERTDRTRIPDRPVRAGCDEGLQVGSWRRFTDFTIESVVSQAAEVLTARVARCRNLLRANVHRLTDGPAVLPWRRASMRVRPARPATSSRPAEQQTPA